MTRQRLPTTELEAALDILEEASQVADPNEFADEASIAPPPLPAGSKRNPEGDFLGRSEFPELFKMEPTEGDPARMNPEEKVAFLRQRLKHAEDMISRFRAAWSTRNQEFDHVEALLDRALRDSTRANTRLEQLEQFLEQKRSEIENYAQQVAKAFSVQEERENELREQLADEQSEHERLRDEVDTAQRSREESEKVREELEPRVVQLETKNRTLTEELQEAHGEVALLRAQVSDRDAKLDELSFDATDTEQRLRAAAVNRDEELSEKLRQAREQIDSMQIELTALQEDRNALAARAESAEAEASTNHNQLVARDELVKHYREQAEELETKLESSTKTALPPPPTTAFNREAIEAIAESIHFSGRTLSAIIKGERAGQDSLRGLRDVLKSLKSVRNTLDELESDRASDGHE